MTTVAGKPIGTDAAKTMIYTVDLGNGQVADIEGPEGATPEQLQQALKAQQPQQKPDVATIDDPSTTVGGFADQLPAQAASHMSPADEQHVVELLRRGRDDEAVHYAASKGFSLNNLSAIQAGRAKTGQVTSGAVYNLPKATDNGALAAAGGGAIDSATLGFGDELHGAANAVGALVTGGNPGDAYNRTVDQDRAQAAYDEENHAAARLTGELLGGIVVPAGLEKAGLTASIESVALAAGKNALREGLSMSEARQIAARAAARRIAQEGAAYGGVYGAGSSDNDRVGGAITGAATGAAGGYLLGKLGQRLFRRGQPVPAAVDYAALANKYDIPATPATTGGAISAGTQAAFANLPGSIGAVAAATDAENQGLRNAVGRIASGVGNVSTPDQAGRGLVEGAKEYQASSKAKASSLYDARDALMGGTGAPVTLDNAINVYRDIASKYPTSDTLRELAKDPVFRRLGEVISDANPGDGLPHELTLGEATQALSHARSVLRNLQRNGADSDVITSNVSKLENALEGDVKRAASAADLANGRVPGEPGSALAAQNEADRFYADRKRALGGTLKLALASNAKPTEVPAERVYRQLAIDAATPKQGGNIERFRDTWFRVPENRRADFAATYLDDLGRATSSAQNAEGDAWSFQTFLTNFDKLSPQAAKIMFGADAHAQIKEIAQYAERLRSLNRFRNFSNTAKGLLQATVFGTIGTSLLSGNIAHAAEATAALPAAYVGAKVFLATPAMRAWTKSALKIGAIVDPVRAEKATKALVAQLPRIAKASPSTSADILQLHQRLTDLTRTVPARVAADTGNNGLEVPDGQRGQDNGQQQDFQP